jgi:hypothetical protein
MYQLDKIFFMAWAIAGKADDTPFTRAYLAWLNTARAQFSHAISAFPIPQNSPSNPVKIKSTFQNT